MGMGRPVAGEKAGAAEWDLGELVDRRVSIGRTWAEVRDKFHHDVAREHYMNPNHDGSRRSAKKASGRRRPTEEQWRSLVDDALLSGTREDYVAAAEERAGVPNAVVLDGQWLDS